MPAVALTLALAVTGCVSQLDMAAVSDPSRPATTIPYAGVRGSRQFPDYQPIGSSILTGVDPAAAPKGDKPKRGAK